MPSSSKKKTPAFNKLKGKSVGFVGKFGYDDFDRKRMQQIVKNEGGKLVDPLKSPPDYLIQGYGVGSNPPAAGAKIQKKHPSVQLLDASDFMKLVAPTADELISLFRNGPGEREFWDHMVERTQHIGLDLSGADLRKLHLTRVVFYGVALDNADFRGATLDNVSFAKVAGAKFDGANMKGGSFTNAEDCSLKKVMMEEVRWNPAEFTRCDFSGAVLKIYCGSYTTARECSFAKADLSNGDLEESQFQGNDFSGANLSGARLLKCDFTGANLAGANLSLADLRNANLSNCDLRKANFMGAILSNADLTSATIDGADFTDANLNGANIKGLDTSKAKNLEQTPARVAG